MQFIPASACLSSVRINLSEFSTAKSLSKAIERSFLETGECIKNSPSFDSFCGNVSETINTVVAERMPYNERYSYDCSDFLFTSFVQFKSKEEITKEITTLNQSLSKLPDQIYDRIHSSTSDKIDIIRRISHPMAICSNYLTTHFLVNDDKIFGLTVAHADCKQAPHPKWLVPCVFGSPPKEASSVMKITGGVVPAKMGDNSASLFGFIEDGEQERASIGNLVGVALTELNRKDSTFLLFFSNTLILGYIRAIYSRGCRVKVSVF